MLRIKNLHASVNEKEVLTGLSLTVNAGEVHAIMGPNGSGKSTLSKIIAGYPGYEVASGTIEYEINGEYKNLSDLEPNVRANEGIFLAFQYPVEVPGITNMAFLHAAFNANCRYHGAAELNEEKFAKLLHEKAKLVE